MTWLHFKLAVDVFPSLAFLKSELKKYKMPLKIKSCGAVLEEGEEI